MVGGTRILQFGGFEVDGGEMVPLADAAVYDVDRGTWSAVATPPFSRGLFHPAGVWTGKEFVVVGAPCGRTSTDIDVADCGAPRLEAAAYDAATDHWRRIPAPPGTFASASPPEPTGLGWTGSRAVFRLNLADGPFVALDPVAGEWTVMPPLDDVPESYCFTDGALHGVRTTATPDQAYESVAPAELHAAPIRAWRLDVEGRRWKELPAQPKPDVRSTSDRVRCGDGAAGPLLYVPLGGSEGPADGAGAPVLGGVLELRDGAWVELPRPDLDVIGRDQLARVAGTLVWWPESGDRILELRDGADRWAATAEPRPSTPVSELRPGDGFVAARYGDRYGPLRLGLYRPTA